VIHLAALVGGVYKHLENNLDFFVIFYILLPSFFAKDFQVKVLNFTVSI